MRTKEVEEAIKTIQEQKENVECGINDMECMPECYDENIYNEYIELKKKAETLLSYIEELEKENIELRKYYATRKEVEDLKDTINCLHESSKEYINKDKIRGKIKELEDETDKYIGIQGLQYSELALQTVKIQVLNELLKGE